MLQSIELTTTILRRLIMFRNPRDDISTRSVDLVGTYDATAAVRAGLWNGRHLLATGMACHLDSGMLTNLLCYTLVCHPPLAMFSYNCTSHVIARNTVGLHKVYLISHHLFYACHDIAKWLRSSRISQVFEELHVNRSHRYRHCQMHNGPKALSTSTHSTPFVQSRSFNNLWNPGQTSARFCLEKGKKYMWQFRHIHVTNPHSNFDKSM